MTPIDGPRGDVVGWLEDGEYLRDLRGAVIGWLYDDVVHGRRGQHVGYFNDGLFRDNRGAVVGWIEGASGGPVKPVCHVRPVTPVRQVRPVRAVRHVRQVRAARQIAWSTTSFDEWLRLS
ncbi:hypothetical protein FHS07_002949 [Microbacterium proteolyticum]|uniref:4-fold beta flower domain-containing protein n=1 Tax=Microbacterium proteolyticum TaxID=1572644 RepID=A0A7W5CKD6_9MICO|nr:hypothetical protein [Microbacterium proteolyticum]MBB3159231.1 hypothetical protein [Microbacterium proteolyticum]